MTERTILDYNKKHYLNLTNLDDLENRIIEAAKAIQEIDFETLRQEVKDLNELGYKLSTGVQSTQFTEDQPEELTM